MQAVEVVQAEIGDGGCCFAHHRSGQGYSVPQVPVTNQAVSVEAAETPEGAEEAEGVAEVEGVEEVETAGVAEEVEEIVGLVPLVDGL